MNKNRPVNVLSGVFIAIILICLVFIIRDIRNYKSAEKEYKKLNDKMISSDEKHHTKGAAVKDSPECFADETYFERLYKINPDLVGIISVPSLNLLYPIVQGNDNTEYLSYTFERKKNPAGCLFIDCENDCPFTDGNTYIYGHNMKDGSMFGSLKRMTKEEFDRSAAKAYITTRDRVISYKFEKTEVVKINEYKAPQNAEGLLTLYTCWGNDKSRRLLVTFLKEDEKYDVS